MATCKEATTVHVFPFLLQNPLPGNNWKLEKTTYDHTISSTPTPVHTTLENEVKIIQQKSTEVVCVTNLERWTEWPTIQPTE